jgi:hypothetical protein
MNDPHQDLGERIALIVDQTVEDELMSWNQVIFTLRCVYVGYAQSALKTGEVTKEQLKELHKTVPMDLRKVKRKG